MPKQKASKPLRVMLVDDRIDRREMLDIALQNIDCALVACTTSDSDLLSAVKTCDPDVILVDIEAPGRDILESLETVHSTVPRPMVMFSQDDNNQTIRRATQAGVSAYVVDGLQISRVRPIIDAAVARFQHFSLLETELKQARNQLAERKIIDKAKRIVMRRQDVSEEVAYKSMRKLAMDSNKKLSEVAQRVIAAEKLLGK
ncbi:MAG: ANTAR domain-containing protein [Gammaproteobacteria bacterium]|nr:ANTAR domain-containing protein [Gammaproteobacteria bacterium]